MVLTIVAAQSTDTLLTNISKLYQMIPSWLSPEMFTIARLTWYQMLRFHATRLVPQVVLEPAYLWDDMFLDTEVQPVRSASSF